MTVAIIVLLLEIIKAVLREELRENVFLLSLAYIPLFTSTTVFLEGRVGQDKR